MDSLSEIREQWLAELFSTAPADRTRAETAVRALYAAAGFREPQHFLWFDSPFAASWAVAVLAAPHHRIWAQKLSSSTLSRQDRERIEAARTRLGQPFGGATWPVVAAALGAPLSSRLRFPPDPSRMFETKLFDARYQLSDDIAAMVARQTQEDALQAAEQRFIGSNLGALCSALHCPTTDLLIGDSFIETYPFSMMAHDQEQVGGGEPPPLMRAAWEIARSSGLWWPFENAAILSDRPAELYLDEQRLLHRGDGPAAVYRDGWRVYAWKGKAVPEKWIMQPELVPAREFKGFDPTFGKYIASRVAPPSKAKKRGRPAAILGAVLPADPLARLAALRAGAGGPLPFFDRYRAGEHQKVWAELIALGPSVREDPHAADALAVAYETMQRVEANVRTLVERLRAVNYRFAATPLRRPDPAVRKALASFEKDVGVLPLSLRVFYEAVGEVNLLGHHPVISPRTGDLATDQLLVYGFDEGLAERDDDDDGTCAITIAPDDLHKADTSGGSPYEMAVPDPRVDGELLNERHQLFFVDYLHLCFRFGGFPGYDGVEAVPQEIQTLGAGLIDF